MKEQLEEHWHYFIDDDGTPQAVNSHTGEVALKSPPGDLDKYQCVRIGGVDYWVPHGSSEVRVSERQYNSLVAEKFCGLLVSGKSMLEACHGVGISYYTLCKWRRLYPEFQSMLDQAKEDRAEVIFEELLHIAKETGETKDEVALGRLRSDIYKHISAVGSDKFNPRSKVDLATTIGIKVADTGISRERELTEEEKELFERISAQQARSISGKVDG